MNETAEAAALYERALGIAARAHAGQTDLAGEPYIYHPMRVADRLSDPIEKVIAILHDVVEDTDVTLEDLAAAGFGESIVADVEHLTRRDGESYDDFITRIAPHERARKVKLADLADNMDLRRIPNPTARDFARTEKYLRASEVLRLSGWRRWALRYALPLVSRFEKRYPRMGENVALGIGVAVIASVPISGLVALFVVIDAIQSL